MIRRIIPIILGTLSFGVLYASLSPSLFAASSAVVNATITISVCGNNVIEGGEECDGSDIAGQTCSTRGFVTGTLSCRSDCTFLTNQCTSSQGSSGGGGGGSGGGSSTSSAQPPTAVVITGKAFPFASLTILKDGQVIATAAASANGQFTATMSGLSAGSYIIGIYAQDAQGNRSPLLTVPVVIASGTTTTIADTVIPAVASSAQSATSRRKGDVNGDNKVNLIDFSIAAYWYRRTSPPASVDSNGDGKVDLIDVSIMAFYWTG